MVKNMAKRGKMAIKKWFFGGKKWVIWFGKLRAGNQTRKVKWCKMQTITLNLG